MHDFVGLLLARARPAVFLERPPTGQATSPPLAIATTVAASRDTTIANLRHIAFLPTIRPLAVPRHSAQHAPVAMLAVWSRAARNPGTCRCMSCVSHAKAVVRRRGRSGLRASWALGTPTSTFLYTAMFAAGLAMDAKAKSSRSRQWEEAFGQLREALDRPADAPATATSAADPEPTTPPDASQDSDRPSGDAAVRTWTDLRLDSRFPGAQVLKWPANTGRDLVPHNLPPQSLWAPDVLRWSAIRRRQTRKKLAMQELTVGLLIHNLTRAVNLARFGKTADDVLDRLAPYIRHIASTSDAEAEDIREAFLADIKRLHLTHVSCSPEQIAKTRIRVTPLAVPSYSQDADGDFYGICKQMNDGITQLVNRCKKGGDQEKAFAVAKICHNLLVSTSAPDLHTFNTLIAGFTLWRRPMLVDSVITALFTSKIRPNEFICTQILHHYATHSRADDFVRFVSKMRGVGGALVLASPAVNINEASQDRLLRINDDKVYQKIHPTPMVFDALIGGVMKFAGFDRALDIYYEMKADGWGLAITGLIKLLADCIRRADWEGGTYVWEEINSIKTRVSASEAAKAYDHMLSLCSVTGNTVAFNQVLNEVAKRGFDEKLIINGALRTTRWAKFKTDNIAPAWVADNLMIAVSSYMSGTKPPNETNKDDSHDELEHDAYTSTEPTLEEESTFAAQYDTMPKIEDSLADEKEAWASWVEHEFGEKPRDPKP
jgi:hypothetical protein